MAVHDEGSATLGRIRRAVFVRRMRLAARRAGASVQIDVAKDAILGAGIRVRFDPGSSNRVVVGPRTRIRDGVRLNLHGGTLHLGAYCDIRDECVLNLGGELIAHDGVILSWGTTVHCDGTIELGEFTGVSDGAALVDSSHYYTDPDTPFHANLKTGTIRTGRHVWVGTRAVVLKGADLGDHATVGAGAVVSGTVPAGHVAVGNPAQVRARSRPLPWLTDREADA